MVAPGFLDNPEVRRWLGGIQPAWTMLEFNSLNALHHEPSGTNHAIRLEPDLTNAEISGSAVTANALLLLRRAADTGRLKLTATGNLSRALVEEMCGIMEWPGYDKDELFGFHKVINEPDFFPLHFVRILTQAAKLFRTYRGKLVPTPLGRRVLSGEQHGPLQALLFHVAFWRVNLGYFDRYAVDTWPQNEIGVRRDRRYSGGSPAGNWSDDIGAEPRWREPFARHLNDRGSSAVRAPLERPRFF